MSVAERTYGFDPELRALEVEAWRPFLEERGWRRGDERPQLYFARSLPDPSRFQRLRSGARINRFPGMAAYGIKSDLCVNLRRAAGWMREAARHPRTYLLPEEEGEWRRVAAAQRERRWLLKPRASSLGRGLRLVDAEGQLPDGDDWLVQEYLEPHLLDGHKYGLRFYLLITSLDPLIAYVHRRGTCRVATRPYATAGDAARDPLRHFINTIVQRRNPEHPWHVRSTDLGGYWRWIETLGHDAASLRAEIHEQLAAMLLAVREQALLESLAVTRRLAGCFEFLGVDLQLDERLRPWILECNVAPPMEDEDGRAPGADPPGFYAAVKGELIRDQLAVLEAGLEATDPDPSAPLEQRQQYWRRRSALELAARGGWQPLWPPAKEVVGEVAEALGTSFAPLARPLDRALARRRGVPLASPPRRHPAAAVRWLCCDDGLVLWHSVKRRAYGLDALAATVWSGLAEGAQPEQLIDEIAAGLGAPRARIEDDVWSLLIAWTQAGLLAGAADGSGEACGSPCPDRQDPLAERRQRFDVEEATVATAAAVRAAVSLDGDRLVVDLRQAGDPPLSSGSNGSSETVSVAAAPRPREGVGSLLLVVGDGGGDPVQTQLRRRRTIAVLDTLAAAGPLADSFAALASLVEWLQQIELLEVSRPFRDRRFEPGGSPESGAEPASTYNPPGHE